MGQSQHEIQIALEGLITLLAQNLYADPDVFLREMIQNAHDSVMKRAALAEQRRETAPGGRIDIDIDRDASTLSITDNGAGLTRDEIHNYLSTIGRSGTREFREQFAEHAASLIGQFGIGLLSAFIVARRVEVVTRSVTGGAALRWVSDGGRQYTVEETERADVGSTVTLHLRTDHARYLDAERLRTIVRIYADFLGVPVYVGDDPTSANAVNAPWHRTWSSADERRSAHHHYWEQHFKEEQSLDIFPLDETITWVDRHTAKEQTGRLQGVLGITDRHVPDVNTRGTVDLYIKRMFITAGSREILPTWARFIQGVVECDVLNPNAARDNVSRNEALDAVRERLGAVVLDHLTRLSKSDPRRFTEIMRWHAYHVLGMAVLPEHKEFFRAVADIVPLASDQGLITVQEYLKSATRLTDGRQVVHFIAERGSTAQFFLLCRSKGLRVFDTSEPFAERFLQRYQEEWPTRVSLNRLDVSSSEVIFGRIEEADQVRYRGLESAYASLFPDLRCIAKASRFEPTELPAVLTATSDGNTRQQMEDLAGNPAIPTFIRDLVGNFVKEKRDPLTLHLNVANPIIQRLAGRATARDEVADNALIALYNNALMLVSRTLSPDDIQKMFRQYNHVIELMIQGQDERSQSAGAVESLKARVETMEREKLGRNGLSEAITCFVAMPFNKPELDVVYRALETILEDVPYLWNVGRADDLPVADRMLWTNVERHMTSAHCFIAEISEPNLNVMIEIGRMEALRRPILLLKRKDSSPVPADLRGHLRVEYEGEGDALVALLRAEIARDPAFLGQQGERWLSPTFLRREGEMSDEVCRRLSAHFRTCKALLAADIEREAQVAGVRPNTIRGAQEWVRDQLRRLGDGGRV